MRYKKNKNDYYYSKFSHYRKFVKIAITSDRLNWCKNIEKDLTTQPTKFCHFYET